MLITRSQITINHVVSRCKIRNNHENFDRINRELGTLQDTKYTWSQNKRELRYQLIAYHLTQSVYLFFGGLEFFAFVWKIIKKTMIKVIRIIWNSEKTKIFDFKKLSNFWQSIWFPIPTVWNLQKIINLSVGLFIFFCFFFLTVWRPILKFLAFFLIFYASLVILGLLKNEYWVLEKLLKLRIFQKKNYFSVPRFFQNF